MDLFRRTLGDQILNILEEHEEPMTHNEIYNSLDKKYYRSSVFQALRKLVSKGVLTRKFDEERQCYVYEVVKDGSD